MAVAGRLEPGFVHDVLDVEHPGTIEMLVNAIRGRCDASPKDIVALLRAMVRDGDLQVKQREQARLPGWIGSFIEKHPFLKSLLRYLETEALFKALSLVIVCNLVSWIILLAFQASMALAPFRVIFHGTNLLFLPGFAMTISWYPFPSTRLDFSRLERASPARDGQKRMDGNPNRTLGILARIAYSICFSICLVILAGFVIGLLGLGFNITVLHGLFTCLELAIVIDIIMKTRKLRDPYLHI